jgi:hypothetical protein
MILPEAMPIVGVRKELQVFVMLTRSYVLLLHFGMEMIPF